MRDRHPCVYLLASGRNGTLYVGVASDLPVRLHRDRSEAPNGFTEGYAVPRLVWCELHEAMTGAITREKQIKGWRRAWKLAEELGFPPLPSCRT